jgi:hypothetical protein
LTDAAVVLATALVLTFSAAGLGKLVSKPSKRELLISFAELTISALLCLGKLAIQAAIAACLLSMAFLIHAYFAQPTQRCQCFGKRLPSSGRSAHRYRNVGLAVVALAYGVSLLPARGHQPDLWEADVIMGLVVATFIVVGPWFMEWVVGTSEMPEGQATG